VRGYDTVLAVPSAVAVYPATERACAEVVHLASYNSLSSSVGLSVNSWYLVPGRLPETVEPPAYATARVLSATLFPANKEDKLPTTKAANAITC